jgi:type IV pilus assembly protein PilC
MPLIVTPGRLSKLSEFYHQLSSMLAAGLTLVQTLEQIHRSPPAAFLRRPVQHLLDGLQQGLDFSDALATLPDWLPSFDVALIAAGEKSGRLDAVFRILSDYYQARSKLARQVIGYLMYPAFMVIAAVFLGPFIPSGGPFADGNWGGYFRETFGVLLLGFVVIFLLLYACQGRRGEFWRSLLERLLHPVPILGKARRQLAVSRLATALEALLNAGVPIFQAWEMAAAASGSPALRRAVAGWESRLQSGDSPGDLLPQTPVFPDMFANLYHTGEISGTLDDTLQRLKTYYEDEASRRLQALAWWLPRVVYFALVVYLAFKVVGFWLGYYDMILSSPLGSPE